MTSRRPYLSEGLLLLCAAACLLPIALIVFSSFKPDAEILRYQGLLPKSPTLENYRQVMGTPEEFPIWRWFLNSILISGATTLLVLTVDSLAAYGLARLRLPGSKVLLAVIVATMMIPGQILLVPVYLLLNRLGWIDTPLSLIVPSGAGAFGVFLLYQFLKSVPREIEEAAHLDGCSRLRTYAQVVLPAIKPALATLAIFTFVGSWNDFLGPLVYLDSSEKYTLPVGLATFQSAHYTDYGITLAACVVSTAPILIVFLLFQRHIVDSLAGAAGKE